MGMHHDALAPQSRSRCWQRTKRPHGQYYHPLKRPPPFFGIPPRTQIMRPLTAWQKPSLDGGTHEECNNPVVGANFKKAGPWGGDTTHPVYIWFDAAVGKARDPRASGVGIPHTQQPQRGNNSSSCCCALPSLLVNESIKSPPRRCQIIALRCPDTPADLIRGARQPSFCLTPCACLNPSRPIEPVALHWCAHPNARATTHHRRPVQSSQMALTSTRRSAGGDTTRCVLYSAHRSIDVDRSMSSMCVFVVYPTKCIRGSPQIYPCASFLGGLARSTGAGAMGEAGRRRPRGRGRPTG